MQTTTTAIAHPGPEAECCICTNPVDVRKICAVWRDGKLAHLDCYDSDWLNAGIADRIAPGGLS